MADNKTWLGRSVAGGSVKAIAYHITLTYVIPLGLPAVTAIAGYLQGSPVMYIFVAAGVMFAAVATGLVKFDEWIGRRQVRGKLTFASVRFCKDIRGGNGFALGVAVRSVADASVEFEIDSMLTRLGNRVPAKRIYDVRKFIIPPQGNGFFDDHLIDIEKPPSPGTIEGLIECKIKYGHVGNLKYDLTLKKSVVMSFDKDGLPGPGAWNDAV